MSYINSRNEWEIENLCITSSIIAGGDQLCIQDPNKGAIFHITAKPNFTTDLMKVENTLKEEVFRIDHDGHIYVNGSVFVNTGESASEEFEIDGNIQMQADSSVFFDETKVLTKNQLMLEIGDTADGVYLGDPNENGSWKLTVSGNTGGDLLFQKRINGIWVDRQCIN